MTLPTEHRDIVTWLSVPLSWAHAAYLLTLEAASDCEVNAASRDTFQRQLDEVAAANTEMAQARKELEKALAPDVQRMLAGANMMQLSGRYVSAVRSLAGSIKVDCELSSANKEIYGAILKRFELEETALATSSAGAAAAPLTAPKRLAFKQMGAPEDMCQHSVTPFGTYVLDGFPKGWMVSFQFGTSARRIHDRVGLSFEGAIQMAQNDFDQRVAQCLEPSQNELAHSPGAKPTDNATARRSRPR